MIIGVDLNDTLTGLWNFSDSTTANGLNVSKTFSSTGTFTATFTITDRFGSSDTNQLSITISSSSELSGGSSGGGSGGSAGGGFRATRGLTPEPIEIIKDQSQLKKTNFMPQQHPKQIETIKKVESLPEKKASMQPKNKLTRQLIKVKMTKPVKSSILSSALILAIILAITILENKKRRTNRKKRNLKRRNNKKHKNKRK